MSAQEAVDKAGREIKTGALIVYGHALGRCAGLRYGKVLAITWKEEPYGRGFVPHFTVRGIDDDWGQQRAPKLNLRNGTLQYSDRILVVNRAQVPARTLELLDTVAP